MRRALLAPCIGLVFAQSASLPAIAQMPGQTVESTPVQSADRKEVPLDSAFRARLLEPGRSRTSGALAKALEGQPVFLRDTNLTFKPRTYYFDQSNSDGTDEEAWALGGSLEYKSGLAWDRVWVGAEVFGSWPLYKGSNAGETLLLTSQADEFTVVGQAYLAANLAPTSQVVAGRISSVETPYANRQFNRMTPNAFQGALVNGAVGLNAGPDDEKFARRLHYLVGYLDKIKERNSERFVAMSQAAGSSLRRGTALGGARYTEGTFSAGLIEYFTPDVLNIFYAGANYAPRLAAAYELKLSAQFTDQRPLAGSGNAPHSNQWGLEAVGSYSNAVLTLSFTQTSEEGEISTPWGSAPSFTRTSIHTDARAGESAVLASFSYTFGERAQTGLSATAVAAYYWDAVSTLASPQPDQTEIDLYLDYRIPKGVLDGLWFRLQPNWQFDTGGGHTTQLRAIVYWEVPLL